MSLDFYLEVDACTACGRSADESFSANYTHNVAPMWRKAGVYGALYESHGKSAGTIIEALRSGVAAMESDPSGYMALDPANRWGSYETALPWLRGVLAACEMHPTAKIRISR